MKKLIPKLKENLVRDLVSKVNYNKNQNEVFKKGEERSKHLKIKVVSEVILFFSNVENVT